MDISSGSSYPASSLSNFAPHPFIIDDIECSSMEGFLQSLKFKYQKLLDKAFFELSKNSSFKKALLATKNANLTHSIGKKKSSETVLTKKEFIGRLMKIREELKEKK